MKKFKQVEPGQSQLEKILDAGIEEFAERGLGGARIGAISKRAGVAPSLLYYYFDHKEDLYLAVLENAMKSVVLDIGSKLRATDGFIEALGPGMLSSFEVISRRPALTRLILRECVDGARYLALLKKKHPEWVGSNLRMMSGRLKEAMSAGVVRQVDAERTIALSAAALFLILGARPVLDLMDVSPEHADDPGQWFAVLIDILVNSFRP